MSDDEGPHRLELCFASVVEPAEALLALDLSTLHAYAVACERSRGVALTLPTPGGWYQEAGLDVEVTPAGLVTLRTGGAELVVSRLAALDELAGYGCRPAYDPLRVFVRRR